LYTRTTTAVVGLLTTGLLLTGCSGGGSDEAGNGSAIAKAAPAATTTAPPTTTSAPVKLSTEWNPKLKTASLDATKACQTSGSAECLDAMDNSVVTLSAVVDAIAAADAVAEYAKTIGEMDKLMSAARAFVEDECPGDPSADVEGSPCYGHAVTLTVGLTGLSSVMQTDEANAGAL